jgi:hypothetical protein
MRIRVALLVGSLGLLGSTVAHAQTWEGTSSTAEFSSKAKRRSDFTLGASAGFGFGRASGYPNEVQKIGDSAYESNTKLAIGNGSLIWLGVAFNDYLSFGLGLGGMSLSGNDRDASAGLFAFHLDTYPLFDLDKNLQDLGFFGNFGTGPLQIKGGAEDADGGLLAYVEGGVVYERLRLWRFAVGPSVSVMHMWSESARLTGALVGARVAFYGGP